MNRQSARRASRDAAQAGFVFNDQDSHRARVSGSDTVREAGLRCH